MAHILAYQAEIISDSKKVNSSHTTRRKLHPENIAEFQSRLLKENWNPIYHSMLNEAFDYFFESLLWCFNVSCQTKKKLETKAIQRAGYLQI